MLIALLILQGIAGLAARSQLDRQVIFEIDEKGSDRMIISLEKKTNWIDVPPWVIPMKCACTCFALCPACLGKEYAKCRGARTHKFFSVGVGGHGISRTAPTRTFGAVDEKYVKGEPTPRPHSACVSGRRYRVKRGASLETGGDWMLE